ncbi:S24/S26 family peptidase [Pelagibacterium flavum]|uniref:S24/S26 family peptidase n=1 Tax=Pelagibacterium flavum TaxID=2984530 RepID=A0ABY6IK68_9HYPH|nr:S24/S26 family peptidase [Pelagibacterium sp. YIM 151497]UYQ70998.1 S24/S26 family peptidase [Pelagibacterium sp. YIM 151497]
MDNADMSGSDLARRLHERRVISTPDRSIPSKIARGEREVSASEVFAIAEITGYPAPNESTGGAIEVPLLAMISAGALLADDVRDEARDILHVADLPPGDWVALEVDGTSMDRVSPPGSRILVNRKDKRLVPNACYVIDDGEGKATYKRYRPGPDRFEPVSTFEHETIFPENEPRIIGRVRFSILPM